MTVTLYPDCNVPCCCGIGKCPFCKCDKNPTSVTVEFHNVDDKDCTNCDEEFDGTEIELFLLDDETCVFYSNFEDASLGCYSAIDTFPVGIYAEIIDDGGDIKWQVTLLDDGGIFLVRFTLNGDLNDNVCTGTFSGSSFSVDTTPGGGPGDGAPDDDICQWIDDGGGVPEITLTVN